MKLLNSTFKTAFFFLGLSMAHSKPAMAQRHLPSGGSEASLMDDFRDNVKRLGQTLNNLNGSDYESEAYIKNGIEISRLADKLKVPPGEFKASLVASGSLCHLSNPDYKRLRYEYNEALLYKYMAERGYDLKKTRSGLLIGNADEIIGTWEVIEDPRGGDMPSSGKLRFHLNARMNFAMEPFNKIIKKNLYNEYSEIKSIKNLKNNYIIESEIINKIDKDPKSKKEAEDIPPTDDPKSEPKKE